MEPRHRWIIFIGALLLAGVVGYFAYNAGFSQGVTESGKIVAAPPGAVPYYYGPRPWGGAFFIWPFFVVAIWVFAFRGFRGHHHRYACR